MLFATFVTHLLLTTVAIPAPGLRIEVPGANAFATAAVATTDHDTLSLRSISKGTYSRVSVSPNWAGAVWDTYPVGTFTAVTGTFIVPAASGSNGAASVWVGIDGYTCKTAILQTGINVHVLSGVASYDAWYEWYPAYARYVTDITISAGDVIRLTVAATSAKNGTAKIENLTTGVTVSNFVESSHPLCMQNAEWIVEDYAMGQDGNWVQFCNFETVQFTDSMATMASGESISTDGTTTVVIEQNGVVLTSVSETSGGVTIKRS